MNQDQKNPLVEIMVNIVLPTLILNKGEPYLGDNATLKVLFIALGLPLAYAFYDYIKNKNVNFISIFGVVSILFTGGFRLMMLEGIWFAVKEAAFPAAIGLVVLGSAFMKNPLIGKLIYNEKIFQIDKVNNALDENSTQDQFKNHLKLSTIFFSGSFFFSALLNYILAIKIFTPISKSLPLEARESILNKQIADMTWQGYVVILLPSLLLMVFILWHLFNGIKKYTGYSVNEIINDPKANEPKANA